MCPRSSSVKAKLPIPAVNFFITPHCNMKCRFCFAHFEDQSLLPWEDKARLLHVLAEAGMQKLTIVGGEPLLCRDLRKVVVKARELNVTTSIVTNGALVSSEWLRDMAPYLDWLGISIDTLDPDANQRSGRAVSGKPLPADHYLFVARETHRWGIRLKLNTVVTAWNWRHDLSGFVSELIPDRWKVFRALPISGQNDAGRDDFSVTAKQFANFTSRHAHCQNVVFEDNEDMEQSYVMVSPDGRLIDNAEGQYRFGSPILECGIAEALAEVSISPAKFEGRGGNYRWR